ncbi:hypothetical protein ABT297_04015 [Dactylosporangium sp. NPDC000555]|uniref:hypothetical protein n=1 Tax=Dactylosporangium sp. NPDC000555 TaxID=3154260 RepID=UPI0033170A50
MAWRAARSLVTLHAQLQRGAPRTKPPATSVNEWGLVADAAHDPTSDHAPHDFPGWGSQIVTAADFPNRPDLGLDVRQVLDDIRRSKDPRVKYGISNGEMFSSYATSAYPAWTWRPYGGKDKHKTHGHLSVVGDARADGEQPWQTIGAAASAPTPTEDDMYTDDDRLRDRQTHALARAMYWGWNTDRAGFIGAKGDEKVWDYAGGMGANVQSQQLGQLLAAAAADEARDKATAAAITALTTVIQQAGGSVTAAPIIAAVRAVGDDTHALVAGLQHQLEAARVREAKLAADLAAALKAAAG